MVIDIREEAPSALAEYARIPTAFEVERVLDLTLVDAGLRGLELRERQLTAPYTKDYDAIAGNAPVDWARRFDVSRWGVLSAHVDGQRIGGAVIALETSGLDLLWDLRVAPSMRGRGAGSRLFAAAVDWAHARGCTRLAVETQNVNVPACRFYAGRGCELGSVRRFAYPELPQEIQLIWYKDLRGRRSEA